MENLTARQREMLDFISNYVSGSGRVPTLREIAGHFHISIGPVQRYVKTLVKKGYLKHTPGIARGLELVSRMPQVSVPVLGRVAAGLPMEALENVEGYVPVEHAAVKGESFALRVKGDSMTGSGIFEGDIVVARKQSSAENGETVVAMVDNEGVVKKLCRKGKNTWLESTNPKYKPIRSKEIVVLGKVIYLVRRYEK